MKELFRRFSATTARAVGSPVSFMLSVVLILVWLLTGPMFRYSDTWQLVINTGTTIITFLMVFLIQNTQNRDAKSLHLKLDELIKATHGARNNMLDLDKLTDEQLSALELEYKKLCGADLCDDEGLGATALARRRRNRQDRKRTGHGSSPATS